VNQTASFGSARGLVLSLVFALCACGSNTSDNTPMNAGAGGGAAGKSAAGSGAAGKGAAGSDATGTGTVPNGGDCNNTAQCAPGLKCLLSVALKQPVQICAQGCADDNACAKGETCVTETTRAADSHCVKTVSDPFAVCGPSNTSVCQTPLDCIFSDLQAGAVPVGYCYNYCLLPGSSLMTSDPTLLKQCPSGLSCLPLGDPDVGLCAHEAARGSACGLDSSALCAATDLCITSINQSSGTVQDQLCYQDCTMDTGSCASGTTCNTIQNGDGTTTGYCMMK
jgi:hypothetical protein